MKVEVNFYIRNYVIEDYRFAVDIILNIYGVEEEFKLTVNEHFYTEHNGIEVRRGDNLNLRIGKIHLKDWPDRDFFAKTTEAFNYYVNDCIENKELYNRPIEGVRHE